VRATGNQGKLKVGFQDAVTLGSWNLELDQSTIGAVYADIRAKIGKIDQFWHTQSPQQLGLWMGQAWWVWSDIEVEYGDRSVDIRAVGNPVAMVTF
jgi:hypothetical protein